MRFIEETKREYHWKWTVWTTLKVNERKKNVANTINSITFHISIRNPNQMIDNWNTRYVSGILLWCGISGKNTLLNLKLILFFFFISFCLGAHHIINIHTYRTHGSFHSQSHPIHFYQIWAYKITICGAVNKWLRQIQSSPFFYERWLQAIKPFISVLSHSSKVWTSCVVASLCNWRALGTSAQSK